MLTHINCWLDIDGRIFLFFAVGTDLRQTIYYGWNRDDVIGVDVASGMHFSTWNSAPSQIEMSAQ
jgi:hypothetical protein